MKNLIYSSLILFFIFQFSVSNAQDTLKSFNNRWSTELNFNPFNGNLSFNNATGQIKLRRFKPNGTARRFAATLNFNRNNSDSENVYGSNPYARELNQNSFFVGINLGKEKHFAGTRRLSPYVGWEFGAGYKSSSQKTKTDTKTTDITGAWTSQVSSSQYSSTQTYTERGFWSLGTNLVTGFDFYMAEKLYFGYEIMLGLDYINYSDIDITEKYSSSSTTSGQSSPDINESSWKFGPKLMNGIRIGFVF